MGQHGSSPEYSRKAGLKSTTSTRPEREAKLQTGGDCGNTGWKFRGLPPAAGSPSEHRRGGRTNPQEQKETPGRPWRCRSLAHEPEGSAPAP
ncbi:hypothetical protein QE152_g38186 [Popillia japonica]|uniref:Uncharacterized protein n=1 Tax=Popillia japonica TaxID=7064 RepID=A0AAW1I8L0_POPJA